eukprot:scaffold147_cov124-Isochrysis_galbana.AAC.3
MARASALSIGKGSVCVQQRQRPLRESQHPPILPQLRLSTTGYALCTPILGQFRAWVEFFGRLRRRRFHLPNRSANFPVGTFVYSKPSDGSPSYHSDTKSPLAVWLEKSKTETNPSLRPTNSTTT